MLVPDVTLVGPMELRVLPVCEGSVASPFVDAIRTPWVPALAIVVATGNRFGHARDVDKPIVGVKAVRGEPEDEVAGLRLLANHGLADRQREQAIHDTWRSAIIGRELVDEQRHAIAFNHETRCAVQHKQSRLWARVPAGDRAPSPSSGKMLPSETTEHWRASRSTPRYERSTSRKGCPTSFAPGRAFS